MSPCLLVGRESKDKRPGFILRQGFLALAKNQHPPGHFPRFHVIESLG